MSLYAIKKVREMLSRKSMICYGTRNEWRKRALKYGISIADIDQLMEALIVLEGRIIDELRSANNNEGDSGEGASNREEESSNEVRSEQTNDESTSAGGD